MHYGINVNYLAKKTSFEKAVKAVSQAGFTTLDYTPDCTKDTWEADMNQALEIITSAGLSVHQTHAPFNRYNRHGEHHRVRVQRALQATRVSNAKYMVVHGDEFDFENIEYTPQKALEYNYEFFAPFVEEAAASNIKIAFETVFEDSNRPRFCSQADDLQALIERFHSDTVCCCWDFGHAGVSFKDEQPQKILQLGKYIECTHVHDCGHHSDLHLPPFLGDIKWDACMSAFSQIGYQGNLTFEMVYGEIPDAFVQAFADYLKKTADLLHTMMV